MKLYSNVLAVMQSFWDNEQNRLKLIDTHSIIIDLFLLNFVMLFYWVRLNILFYIPGSTILYCFRDTQMCQIFRKYCLLIK